MTNEEQYFLNEYALQSLRNTADQDYIAARSSYKASLIEPFLWSSLHSIEKYLKAILLLNSIKAKRFGHDICKLLESVKRIEELNFRLPSDVEVFVNYINNYGENRYYEGGVNLEEYALDNLDQTIWYIRRYCYNWKAYEGFNVSKIDPSYFEANPKKFKLSDGFIEKTILEKSSAYPYLAWNNCFFGEELCNRAEVRKNQSTFSFINPILPYWGKEAFDVLKNYVDFSNSTKKYFQNPDLIG